MTGRMLYRPVLLSDLVHPDAAQRSAGPPALLAVHRSDLPETCVPERQEARQYAVLECGDGVRRTP